VSLTYKEVAEIIKIIDASNLDEFVFEIGGAKMHIRRNGHGGQAMAVPTASTGREPLSTSAQDAAKAPEAARGKADISAGQLAGKVVVRSPTVGIFYRAPSPKEPPFVEVGSAIKRGDPLCLIEVMKLFTTISSDQDGRIAQIPAANGDFVEFDQILFVIEPD
jgi:acetyl-CoA carboxylase biotin carboxyl carrier protein